MGMQNQRTIYGQTLVEMGREDKRIVVLEADLGKSTMTYLFQKEFPERYFEMGIAEANMASFAAGLSLTGKIVFINSFAVFVSGRAYDQIRQSIAIGKLNVKVIGSSYGLSDFGDGATHQSIEDIAIMRAIPNMTVLAPVDGTEAKKIIRSITEYKGPVYVRLNRNDMPDVIAKDWEFEIGKPYIAREGMDVAIFAHGLMVSKALRAAELMEKEGISVRVVNVSTLKPVNENAIKEMSEGVKGIVVAEEHSIIGGLASVVAYIMRGSELPIEVIGIEDVFGQSAESYQELLEYYGLTEKEISSAVKKIMGRSV